MLLIDVDKGVNLIPVFTVRLPQIERGSIIIRSVLSGNIKKKNTKAPQRANNNLSASLLGSNSCVKPHLLCYISYIIGMGRSFDNWNQTYLFSCEFELRAKKCLLKWVTALTIGTKHISIQRSGIWLPFLERQLNYYHYECCCCSSCYRYCYHYYYHFILSLLSSSLVSSTVLSISSLLSSSSLLLSLSYHQHHYPRHYYLHPNFLKV